MTDRQEPILSHECCLTLPQAAAILPEIAGVAVSRTTIWRWAVKGIDGVVLETFVLGKRLITSREALLRFATRLETNSLERSANS